MNLRKITTALIIPVNFAIAAQPTVTPGTSPTVTTDSGSVPGEQTVDGISLGVAFGATIYPQQNIKTAGLQNGVVAITESDNKSVGLWLETHYFFGFGERGAALDSSGKPIVDSDGKAESAHLFGTGPFLAIQAASTGGSNNVINSFGIGWMIGARRSASSTNSFNLGIGYSYASITALGGGMTVGKALPAGATSVATQSKYVGAPFLIASFSY